MRRSDLLCNKIMMDLPADLEVRSCPESGRGLYARKAIPRGSKLLSAQIPLAHVAWEDSREKICQNCLRRSEENLPKCAACKFIFYCDKACQEGDWKSHKTECAGIKRIRKTAFMETLSDTMLLVARLVKMAKKSKPKKQQLKYLFGCEIEQLKKNWPSFVKAVGFFLGDTREGTRSAIICILTKVEANGFTVMDDSHIEIVGMALYGPASLVNHSCQPNSLVVFSGKELTLRAMSALQPGDQVLITYTELMESRKRRQDHLMKKYSFSCGCPRCQVEESEDSPWKMMYAKNNVSVSEELKWSAMKQGFSLLDNTLKELKKVIDILSPLGDHKLVVKNCCDFLAEFGGVLHPLNVVLTCIRQHLMRAQLNLCQCDFAAVLETGEFLTSAYKKFLPEWHPVLVLHLIEMGRLYHRLATTDRDNLCKALLELEAAQKHLPLILGGRSSLKSEVSTMLSDIRRKLECEGPMQRSSSPEVSESELGGSSIADGALLYSETYHQED